MCVKLDSKGSLIIYGLGGGKVQGRQAKSDDPQRGCKILDASRRRGAKNFGLRPKGGVEKF